MKYIVKKKDLPRLHKAINECFEKAPKSLEDWIASPNYVPPIPAGMTHKEFEENEKILTALFLTHNEKMCSCNAKRKCLFKSYEDKEMSREEIIRTYKS